MKKCLGVMASIATHCLITAFPKDAAGARKVEAARGNMHCQPLGSTSGALVLGSPGFKKLTASWTVVYKDDLTPTPSSLEC